MALVIGSQISGNRLWASRRAFWVQIFGAPAELFLVLDQRRRPTGTAWRPTWVWFSTRASSLTALVHDKP
jgi:hypothetical protein